jgi:rhodanese-related sulfurtransferase
MTTKKSKKVLKKQFPAWGWIVIAVVILAVVAVIIIQSAQPGETRLPAEVTVTQAATLRTEGAFVLDVRELSEWTQFHIPGATLIPLGELPNRLNEVPKDQKIVVVCRSGNRSAQGRDILLNAGFTQVTSMSGGVTEWQAQGLEIVTGQ